MSTTTITRTWKVDGVLTDVTSMTLRDPTNTFGVRRTDTGATVVGAGTAMGRLSVGTYSYSFTDPAPGLLYNYFEEVVYQGATYVFEKERSGPAFMPSRSYLLAADADYLASQLPQSMLANWLDADDATKTRALEQSSMDVDAAGPFQGRKYDSAQVRQFPRVAYESRVPTQYPAGVNGVADSIWDFDQSLQLAVVPTDVKIAVLYQAEAVLAGTLQQRQDAQHAGLASQSVGGLSESYFKSESGGAVLSGPGVLARPAAQLLEKYRLRSGRLL